MSAVEATVSFNAGARVKEWGVAANMLANGEECSRFQDYMDCFGDEVAECLEDMLVKYRPASFIGGASYLDGHKITLKFEWLLEDVEAAADHFEKLLTLCGATEIKIRLWSNMGD